MKIKIKSKSILTNLLVIILVISLLLPLTGCQDEGGNSVSEQTQIENLEKLCKVWGYVKYTHPVFLLGEKDWDEELLKLIPQVQKCKNPEKTNELLHEWFISLGKINYGTVNRVPVWVGSKEEDKVVQADTAWILDTSYIGEKLSADLSQLKVIPDIYRDKAPVKFSQQGVSLMQLTDFSNEKTYADMDYSDTSYRLLGLFRLWNAMEYYNPYLDILDEDWEKQLSKYIPEMMAGEDKQSYQLTIDAVSAKLQDAHVFIKGSETLLGNWYTPIKLRDVEGKIVVTDILDSSCPFKIGDIILKIDGKTIEDKIEELKEYISISSDNKLEVNLFPYLLISQTRVTYTVLRDGKEEEVVVHTRSINKSGLDYKSLLSHERLDDNIGLINPGKLEPDEGFSIMKEFKDTDGLIIDLRQYPSDYHTVLSLPYYFIRESVPFAIMSMPSQAVPGTFIKIICNIYDMGDYEKSYYYDKNVVVLMDETSMSLSEYTIMALRTGENVTVMGEESIGADGDVVYLPLPGQISMRFTSRGVYTPDGGQTQRIGLSPDIRVEPTIQGIKDGRDELMDAAIQYLKGNK